MTCGSRMTCMLIQSDVTNKWDAPPPPSLVLVDGNRGEINVEKRHGLIVPFRHWGLIPRNLTHYYIKASKQSYFEGHTQLAVNRSKSSISAVSDSYGTIDSCSYSVQVVLRIPLLALPASDDWCLGFQSEPRLTDACQIAGGFAK